MADTTVSLQADLDALNRAIVDGVRQVTIGGQTVTYNTTDSLIRARDDAQRRLNALTAAEASTTARSRVVYLSHAGRGY